MQTFIRTCNIYIYIYGTTIRAKLGRGKKKEKRGGEIRIGHIHRRKVAAHSAMRL